MVGTRRISLGCVKALSFGLKQVHFRAMSSCFHTYSYLCSGVVGCVCFHPS